MAHWRRMIETVDGPLTSRLNLALGAGSWADCAATWPSSQHLQGGSRVSAGEDPRASGGLARRSVQLVSGRTRRGIAGAVERVCVKRHDRAVFSAVIPVDGRTLEIGRPALEQLARALRSRESVQPGGVARSQLLLTDGASPLYRPAYPEELCEVAREALLALGSVGRPRGWVGVRGGAEVLEDQFGSR